MAGLKNILVVTTSSMDGIKIKKYLKPVSAHIVAGTNLFSDFLGGITDIFGGRSNTYQKQLTSLYNEAIEKLKYAAYEIGGNCIIGLSIDMDEISGKNKSMFMLSAIGTAVILEKDLVETPVLSIDKLEAVAVDTINILRDKREIVARSVANNLPLNQSVWDFITANQVSEIAPYILQKFAEAISMEQMNPGVYDAFYKYFSAFIDAMPDDKKIDILYTGIIADEKGIMALRLSEMLKVLQLSDFQRNRALLTDKDFTLQKRGMRLITYDKPYYNRQDIVNLEELLQIINSVFPERGNRSLKKQLLSSKEKEVWICECGTTNSIDSFCTSCSKDIYGFKATEINPLVATTNIKQRIDLISECIN